MQTILRILERAGGWNPGLFLRSKTSLIWPLSSKLAHRVDLPSLSPITESRMAISCATPRCASRFAMGNLTLTTTETIS
jgi:hypothetical protein